MIEHAKQFYFKLLKQLTHRVWTCLHMLNGSGRAQQLNWCGKNKFPKKISSQLIWVTAMQI